MNENVNHIIPDTWCVERLGDFVISEKGKKPKNISKVKTKTHHLPYVNIQAFEKNIVQEYTDGVGCVLCEENDFLMVWDGSRSGYIGKAIKGALGSTLVKINFPGIVNDYAYYFLLSKYLQINTRAKGTGTPHVDPGLLWNYQFPIAPYNEQKRIVEKIEELFSDLDKGIEILEKAQKQLMIYRQAVLKWAYEGKLTHGSIKEGELPSGWELVKTGDKIKPINNGYTPTKEFLSEGSGEIPFLKVYNLNFDGSLNSKKNPAFIPEAIHKKDLKRSICYPGDVLINIVGPPLGKVSVVTNEYPEWNINQAIVLFRPNEKVRSKYISYFLQNHVTIQWLENTSKATAGQWNIKVSTCREIPFPYCSVDEQDKLIQEVERRLSVCDKIEEMIEESLKQSEILRYSILKRAFEGKLVPQVPNDEPASILLQRIKADKENNKPVKKEREKKPKSRTKMKEEA